MCLTGSPALVPDPELSSVRELKLCRLPVNSKPVPLVSLARAGNEFANYKPERAAPCLHSSAE